MSDMVASSVSGIQKELQNITLPLHFNALGQKRCVSAAAPPRVSPPLQDMPCAHSTTLGHMTVHQGAGLSQLSTTRSRARASLPWVPGASGGRFNWNWDMHPSDRENKLQEGLLGDGLPPALLVVCLFDLRAWMPTLQMLHPVFSVSSPNSTWGSL